MTVTTNFPYNKEYITQFSQDNNEPEWMRELRLQAFDQAENLAMPEPDKTNISRWNFSKFKHKANGEVISTLNHLPEDIDRKSTRLNSSHVAISYAVFCLKQKK